MGAILLDQNASRRESVFVPCFGCPASTSKSLALLAVRTGAPGVPIFLPRDAAGDRAGEERRTPDAAEQPLAGTVVTLLPRSGVLLARLEEIRARARDSETVYRTSATAIRRAREAYERELWEAGAGDLVRTTVVDAAGAFSVADLPAGEWMLIAPPAG